MMGSGAYLNILGKKLMRFRVEAVEKDRRKMDWIERGTVIDDAGCEERAESKKLPVLDGKISWPHSMTHPRGSNSCSAPKNKSFWVVVVLVLCVCFVFFL